MHAALYNLIIHVIEYFCIFLRQHENEKTVFIAKKPLQYFKYVDNKYIILIHLKSNISKWQNSIVHTCIIKFLSTIVICNSITI